MERERVDEAAFSAYADSAWPSLVRSAVFLGCSLADAEDVAQTALVRTYAAWEKVAAADNREAYGYKILVNCVRDLRRRSRWREHTTDQLPERPVEDLTDAIDTVDSIHHALAGLTKANRDVVVLRYFAQLDERQTAAALGIARGTVKSRLSRALAQLARSRHLSEEAALSIPHDPPSEPSAARNLPISRTRHD